jgi:hypothetical protein
MAVWELWHLKLRGDRPARGRPSNCLVAATDASGKRLTAVVACEWALCPGGLIGEARLDVIRDGKPAADGTGLDGEHVYTSRSILPHPEVRKGDLMVISNARVTFAEQEP